MKDSDTLGDKLNSLDSRMERIEGKLDTHLERMVRAEADISWLRGHVRVSTALFLSAVGALGAILLNMLFPSK